MKELQGYGRLLKKIPMAQVDLATLEFQVAAMLVNFRPALVVDEASDKDEESDDPESSDSD